MFYTEGVWVIFVVVCLFFPVGDVMAQCTPTGDPLEINYTSLLMGCGASQNLSASGGCPPYNWSLSGGGTLTPSGGGNTSATYFAPASNSNCANNAMITLTDCCKNMADIQLAVNCYTSATPALGIVYMIECNGGCWHDSTPDWCDQTHYSRLYAFHNYMWNCQNVVIHDCLTRTCEGWEAPPGWVNEPYNCWHHWAWVRSGSNAYFFLDGTSIALTQTVAWGSLTNINSVYQVGAAKNVAGAQVYVNGWLDEVRISKGIARWTSNFTPPTSEYYP